MWDISQKHKSSQKPTGIFLTDRIQVTAYVKIHKQARDHLGSTASAAFDWQ